MTFSHWLYISGVAVVIATMILRRNVVIPCVLFTFLLGLYWHGSVIGGLNTVFNASYTAGMGLFNIFLIIGCMVALLKAISREGADHLMVKPLKGIMSTPFISFLVIIATTCLISLFFWPTPAAPLLGALLIPVAIRVGLPPMLGAMALALAGQGMTLASDAIIQGAPGLTAKAANVPVEMLTYKGTILAIITGVIAIVLAWVLNKKDIAAFDVAEYLKENTVLTEEVSTKGTAKGKALAWIMSLGMLFVVGSMVILDIKGGDSSALLAGMAILIVCVGALISDGIKGLDSVADYVADGLVFAFKVMGPIIPIAGFFFMGSPESVTSILGEGAPGFLFDVGEKIGTVIPPTGFAAAFGVLILGAITGLDGSGFSGLPVVGTLGAAMAGGDAEVASTLGAIGQMGAIWFGGGTLVAWSSLVAVAGICGVPVLELVRKNIVPVLTGLFVSTVFAVLFLM